MDAVVEQLRAVAPAGLDRMALQKILPAGAARNALDCALWDLEAKRAGVRVSNLLKMGPPRPLECAFTISLADPGTMRQMASEHADMPVLKLKLGSKDDLQCVAAVRAGAPAAKLIVDANEGWTPEKYLRIVPELKRLGVGMIEQPLPADDDAALADMPHPIPVCADESCHDSDSVGQLANRYEMVNIKLDKTGGLTEALRLRAAAIDADLRIMVGCMVGTSLAMAPAMLVAQNAEIVDLDGPLLLARDRDHGIEYVGGSMRPAAAALWG